MQDLPSRLSEYASWYFRLYARVHLLGGILHCGGGGGGGWLSTHQHCLGGRGAGGGRGGVMNAE